MIWLGHAALGTALAGAILMLDPRSRVVGAVLAVLGAATFANLGSAPAVNTELLAAFREIEEACAREIPQARTAACRDVDELRVRCLTESCTSSYYRAELVRLGFVVP